MYKDYGSKSAANAAVQKAGLGGMNVTIEPLPGSRYQPVVNCEMMEDLHEVNRRGFNAKLDAGLFAE